MERPSYRYGSEIRFRNDDAKAVTGRTLSHFIPIAHASRVILIDPFHIIEDNPSLPQPVHDSGADPAQIALIPNGVSLSAHPSGCASGPFD